MKVFIALAALVACSQASLVGHGISTGSSVSSRSEDGLGNYKFAYTEKHSTGGSSRSEAGNPWGVAGSYSLVDIDGRQRVVNYVADKLGFRAAIKTNEPGTAPSAPAAASIASPGVVVAKAIAAPVAVAAPLVHAASVAAPVWGNAHAAPVWGGVGPVWGGAANLGAAYSVGISHAAPVLAKHW